MVHRVYTLFIFLFFPLLSYQPLVAVSRSSHSFMATKREEGKSGRGEGKKNQMRGCFLRATIHMSLVIMLLNKHY